MTRFVAVLAFVLIAPVLAQEKPKDPPKTEAAAPAAVPVLSDADKKDIVDKVNARQMLATQLENFQLKAQMTSVELEKATTALNQLITEKTPPGYQINDKLELVKVEVKK
jgi:hypothetical protein